MRGESLVKFNRTQFHVLVSCGYTRRILKPVPHPLE
jgi:hypothetical protein